MKKISPMNSFINLSLRHQTLSIDDDYPNYRLQCLHVSSHYQIRH